MVVRVAGVELNRLVVLGNRLLVPTQAVVNLAQSAMGGPHSSPRLGELNDAAVVDALERDGAAEVVAGGLELTEHDVGDAPIVVGGRIGRDGRGDGSGGTSRSILITVLKSFTALAG